MANGKETLGVARRLDRDLFSRTAERARHGLQYVRQESGLVAPRLRLRPHVAGRQVRRIGLEQQAIARDVAHERKQMLPAALVADPAGDADVEPELDIGVELVLLAGKAVRNGARRAIAAQDVGEARVRVARVKEERLAELQTQLELRDEPFLLVWMR